jgi:hypothetical protein
MQPRPGITQVVQTRPSQAITDFFLSGESGHCRSCSLLSEGFGGPPVLVSYMHASIPTGSYCDSFWNLPWNFPYIVYLR